MAIYSTLNWIPAPSLPLTKDSNWNESSSLHGMKPSKRVKVASPTQGTCCIGRPRLKQTSSENNNWNFTAPMFLESTSLSFRESQKTVNQVQPASLFRLSIVTIINCTGDQGIYRNGIAKAGAYAPAHQHVGKKIGFILLAVLGMSLMDSCLDPYSIPRALS